MMYGRPPALIEATERPMAQSHYLTSAIRLPITGATPSLTESEGRGLCR
jgi:hypothetical protein